MNKLPANAIAGMSPEDRIAWAHAHFTNHPLRTEEIASILEAVRTGTPVSEPCDLLAIALHDQLEGRLREQALLALYYHLDADDADEVGDAGVAIQLIIDQITHSPREESDEHVRGRKYWIRLQMMIANEAPAEVIVDTVKQFCNGETSSFALDRIAAAIGGDRSALFSIFPHDGTWDVPDTDGWNRAERRAIQATSDAGAVLGTLRKRVSTVLSAAAHNDNSLRRYIESLDAPERAYVVSPLVVRDILKRLSPIRRNRVLAVCSGGTTREDSTRLAGYLTALEEIAAPSQGERDWADQFSILALKATIANVGGCFSHASDTPSLGQLVRPALHLLTSPITDQYDGSATRHSLSKLVGGILRVVFSDPGAATAALAQVDSGDLDLAGALTAALRLDSPYLVNVAADVALLLSRNLVLDQELVQPLLERLSQSPATESGMCSGKDFHEDDIAIPDGVENVYLSSSGEEDGATDEDDGFFSVSGLTGLLEACREPFCAWRIAAALIRHADTTGDQELTSRLLSYAKENEVIGDWEPRADPAAPVASKTPSRAAPPRRQSQQTEDTVEPTVSRQTEGKVDPKQPGPYTLNEIIETMRRVFATSATEWPDLQEEIAQEHERALQEIVSHSQRSRIREIFEGLPDGGRTDVIPIVPIATQIMQRGFASFVPLPSFVPGTLDDRTRYSETDPIEPIGSTEALAYYVARDCLPAARSHQWGIYFRMRPFAALNRTIPGSVGALVEPVAVHELVHHHTAVRAKELDIDRPCGTFRLLEEATADWNGVQHLTRLLNADTITPTRYQEILRLVFPRRDEGGLPGYGDWHLMDSDAAPLSPYFDTGAWDARAPKDYSSGKQLLITATTPPAITPVQLPREHRLWSSILDAIATGEIPMYLDFQ
ncbi:MAG: hypothetical protein PF508_10305 [Spirochaeta sp.]|jgi:hypothetical protein|nr:hypothetical protein [Spirochaeta sp.]